MNQSTPLIDREILFGNPLISGAQISPDGQWISFIKPLDDVRNIWVKPIDGAFENALPVTNDKTRPVSSYFWSRDSKYLLYVQDKGGDENYHLYRLDPSEAITGKIPTSINLSDYPEVRALIYTLPQNEPGVIHLGINDRDKAWHDCYKVDLATGERTLIYENKDKLSGFHFDLEGKLRMVSRATSDGGNEILKITEKGLQRILYATLEESLSPIKFHTDGRVYLISNIGKPDLSGLYLYDLDKEEMTLVESDPENQVDLSSLKFSQKTKALTATVYVGDKKRIYWKDKGLEADYNFLKKEFPGAEISITSSTKEGDVFLFYVNADTDPGKCYLLERKTKRIEYLYTPRPDLPTEHLVPMTPVRYASSDGLEIPAYLSVPKLKANEKCPAVLFVHGGPWARDHWGYHSFAQFLANRGYAVLQINFRGSTGYGKKFLNAAMNEWGEKMQDDLTAGAQYLIEQGIADPNKIAIAGGSYGGYATLAGLTFTPEVYAAGVSIVGPSNLFTLLETIPPYWESARVMFHKRMGDPNTEAGKAQLRRQSPFFHADKIKAPLMVAQGDNDPRVKTSESDQIVIAMRDLGLPVTYINFPDEGHGFVNPDNNMSFIAAMEKFLAEHLGGRYQEEIPQRLQDILSKVTVDIDKLVMPAIVTKEMLSAALPQTKAHLSEGHYIYRLSFDMQGQVMEFELHREIRDEGESWNIKDYAEAESGGSLDESTVMKTSFRPITRIYEQGPMALNYKVENNQIAGTMTVHGEKKPLELNLDKDFLMDGPSLDVFLCALPLEDGYTTTLRVLDSINQKIQTYQYTVEGKENIQAQECYRCLLKSIDGPDKSQTLWVRKSEAPFMMKKHSIIGEMGGAILNVEFLRSGPIEQKVLS